MLNFLTQRLAKRVTDRQNVAWRRKLTSGTPLSLETLECRLLLTTFMVNTVIDNPLATPADQDGFVSLREAITAANTNANFGDATTPGEGGGVVDEITFDSSLTGQTIVLGGEQLVISDQMSITGLGQNTLTISGNGGSRILRIESGVTAAISGVTLTDGAAGDGGGIYNEGTLTVANSVFTNHTAVSDGGAIDNLGTLTVVDSVFSNNWASYGGAIVSWSLLIGSPSLTISNSRFDGNFADDEGGALWNDGLLSVVDSVFSQNSSMNRGGAVVNDGTFNLVNGTFTENSSGTNGGAIKNYTDGKLSIADSTFSDNTAGSAGGAIDNFAGFGPATSSLDVTNTTFTSNSGSSGGAIYTWSPTNISDSTFRENDARLFGGAISNGNTLTIIKNSSFVSNNAGFYGGAIDNTGARMEIANSTLSGNTAGREGGAIENYFARLKLTNSTITGNSTNGTGGGIWNDGTLQVTNSTLVANRADADGDAVGSGGGVYDDGSTTPPVIHNTIIGGNVLGAPQADAASDVVGVVDGSSSHNLIGDAATAGGLADAVNGNIVGNAGSGTIDITTVLDTNLAGNGGPTQTHALVLDGPAVNTGDNSKAVDGDGNPLAFDQRGDGYTRIHGGTVDIGAFEVPPPQPAQIDIKPGSDANPINLASNGLTSVVIFTTDDFDAANLNVSSVVWAGANVAQKNDGSFFSALEDVDGDGDLDLVLHFQLAETDLLDIYEDLLRDDLADGTLDSYRQSVDIALEGLTNDGVSFRGTDSVELFLTGRNLRDFRNQRGM